MFLKLCKPGKYGQWILAFAVGVCSFTAGQAFTWPAPALPMIRHGTAGFTMTPDEESWMVTCLFIANIITPIPAGYIMDFIGRKRTLMIFVLLSICSWLVIYFTHCALGMYIARALVGAWSGFVYTVVPVLIGEVFSAEVRGSMGAVFGIMLYLGGLYEIIFGMFVSYDVLTLISLIPPIILFITLLILPEVPVYYLMKGKKEDAANSMEWLKGECDRTQLDSMEESVKEQLKTRGTFLDIFRVRPYRKAFIIAEALTAFRSMAGLSLLLSYATVTVPKSFLDSEQSFLLLDIVWILGSITSFFIMDKFGRRTLLIFSSIGSTVTMIAVAIWYYLRDMTTVDTESTNWFPLIGLMVNGAFYTMGLVTIPILIQGEIFPVNIKGKASAFACISISFTSGLSVRIYEPLTTNAGVYTNFLVCGISSALAFLFAVTYMIETRGKSLDEIQDILSGKKKKAVTFP